MSTERKRCNQCWKMRLVKFFEKKTELAGKKGGRLYQDCIDCRRARAAMSGRYRAVASRRRLIDAHELVVLTLEEGQNSKLGNIPSTYTSGRTCPDSCTLKNAGCYAEFGFVRLHWQRMKGGLQWGEFLNWVWRLPSDTLWRHNVAGDLPGDGDALDCKKVLALGMHSGASRGFTFTHKPLNRPSEQSAIFALNEAARTGYGMTVNLSADSLEEADERAELGIGPVAVTVPKNHPRFSKTPGGRKVIVCPAQAADLTCETCRLCQNANRTSIVAFRAHGQWAAKIDGKRQLPLIARGE